MASSGLLWAAAAIGAGLLLARATEAPATDLPPSTVIGQQIGQQVRMTSVLVDAVPADEGFWVDSDHGRVWVQIATHRESPYTVRAGDRVSFTGDVVANGPDFPARVGLTTAEGAGDLAAQGAHVTIPVTGLTFTGQPA